MNAGLFEAALRTGGLGTWETDLVAGTRTWTGPAIEIFGIDAPPDLPIPFSERDHLREVMHPDDRSVLDDAHSIFAARDEIEICYRIRHPEKGLRHLSGRGRVIERDADGRPRLVMHIVADVTERREVEMRNLMLMRELTHRTKNQLAVVLGIARRIGRSADTIEEFNAAFTSRIEGIVAGIDALVEPIWQTVSLRSLVTSQLHAFVAEDSPRISVTGENVELEGGAGEALGMALHELVTNALQHGALANERGRIEIAWHIDRADADRPVFRFEWTEHDGPVVPRELTPGFGASVLTRMTESALNAETTLEVRDHGIYWALAAPVMTASRAGGNEQGIVLAPSMR